MSDLTQFPTNYQIKFLRKNKNLTQTELAEILKVTKQAVSSWESGKINPSVYHLHEIDQIFGSELAKERTKDEMQETVVPYQKKLEEIISKLDKILKERESFQENYMDAIIENHEYFSLIKKLKAESENYPDLPPQIQECIKKLSAIKAI